MARTNTIYEWRKHRDLTQEELAKRAGLSASFISLLENDESDFTGETLRQLAAALDVRPSDLLDRKPSDPAPPSPEQMARLQELLNTLRPE